MAELKSLGDITRMTTKVSTPRWVACVAFGMCIGFTYFVFTLLLSHWGWNHEIGEVAWIDALNSVMSDFPFGHWISDGSLRYLCCGLFWAALASAVYALYSRRKNVA